MSDQPPTPRPTSKTALIVCATCGGRFVAAAGATPICFSCRMHTPPEAA